MYSLEKILNQEPVFLHDWDNAFDVIMDFEHVWLRKYQYFASECPCANIETWEEDKRLAKHALEKHSNDNILFASYGTENYSGDAFVLFENNGTLYEVNGSHCSCYGLEDQWEREEVVLEELEHRLTKGTFGKDDYSGNEFHDELCKFLGINLE